MAGSLRGTIHRFLDIPYAAPISGLNRWRPPQPVEPWTGVRTATAPGSVCHQPYISPAQAFLIRRMKAARAYIGAIHTRGLSEGDDCLNLNVWTPTLDSDAKLPVMLWIHGGSFTAGSGVEAQYDGQSLATRGIVVVSINYRLNIWGFLGGDDLFPGDIGRANRGYLDQIQALRWVRANIRRFGGDPDAVTVAGESAGGTSTAAMLMSPETDGLIRRALILSGAAVSIFPHEEVSRFSADYFREVHGVGRGDADALCRLGVEEVRRAAAGIATFLGKRRDRYGALGRAHFSTMNIAVGTREFPAPLADCFRAGRRRGLDLMIGTCKDEARLWTTILPLPDRLAAKAMFGYHSGIMSPQDQPGTTFRNYRCAMPEVPDVRVYERAMTDALFRKWSQAFADSHCEANPGKTWWYRFDWESPAVGGKLGAIHVMDLPGLFQNYDAYRSMIGDEAQARPAGDALHEAVVGFVRTGDPNHAGIPAWPAYEPREQPCMIFDRRSELRHRIDADFAAIW